MGLVAFCAEAALKRGDKVAATAPLVRLRAGAAIARFLVDRANAGEFGVRFHEYDSAQTSAMDAAIHARGGSNSLLWISEWGCIQGH